MRDISSRRAAELQLRNQESQLAQADTMGGLGRWDWNLTSGSGSWSDGLYRIYGRDPAEGVPAFDNWQKTIHPEDQARLAHCIQTALVGASAYHVEFRIFTKDTGQLRYVESRGSPVVDANGKPTNIRGFDLDITERKQAEMALKTSSAQLQLLETCVSRLNDIVLITEAEPFSEPGPRIVFVNDAFVRRTGFTREEAIGKSPRILQGPKTDRKELDRIRAALERWEPVRAELLNYTKSGEEFWIELDIVPVADPTGWYTHWVAVERDVTERKKNLLDLQTSLREKSALLLEVHHRVKNNLQVIGSLLRLESFRSTDAPTKSVLQDMNSRVRSMALLHETVYRKGTFAAIDLGSYVGQIAGESLRSLQTNRGAVQLVLDMGTLQVSLDQATPAGMLVSELVSNCLKHAFPEDRAGEICIKLLPLKESGYWRLQVRDSGIGLPADFEDLRKTSLGLQLAGDMAMQMGGTLHIGSGPQAVFTIDFKAEVPAPLVMSLDGAEL
jgi:PAS domain S-box-containing protein